MIDGNKILPKKPKKNTQIAVYIRAMYTFAQRIYYMCSDRHG